jgi:DNA polymerase family A
VRVLLAPSRSGWVLRRLETGEEQQSNQAADDVSRLERDAPRWVWSSTAAVYPGLLGAGVHVGRCHDLMLTRALLNAHAGQWAPLEIHEPDNAVQESLFPLETLPPGRRGPGSGSGSGSMPADDAVTALAQELAAQEAGIQAAAAVSPGFRLLVAAESAAALAAAEMGHTGLPWRADVHDRVLTELLGERPRHGGRPPKLQALAVEVAGLLDDPLLNPDSPAEVLKAFRRQGVLLESTRAWELKKLEHPAVAPLLRYKELSRLHTAHGWVWRETWVHDGRFKPEYIPGGVVSGRWASRGGGALQIPRPMRAAAVADDGWSLVVADAGQLEPRLLAALSDDPGMVAATRAGDLYTDIARQALGRVDARAEAKIGLLAAMYGGGHQSAAMAALRRRFPKALALLENAARIGEDGGLVRSVLGRTSPPPGANWQSGPDAAVLARSRARGRFTRNFVIQASAADWANVLVAELRRRLTGLRPAELVFFQHDEVVVHTPTGLAPAVIEAITQAGAEATRLVVGDRGVRIPLTGAAVRSYAEKP